MKADVAMYEALANPLRLHTVNLLLRRGLCVCELAYILGVSDSCLSNHLTVLKRCGITNERRVAWWIQYTIRPFAEATPMWCLLKSVQCLSKVDSTLKRDVRMLGSRHGRIPPVKACRERLRERRRAALLLKRPR
ncbi:MAG: metalloregulator ArsR/SmtB family transcription factor [Planctomycetota bacterium]|nr:metalloregulator ArsR/SmtB family transcription factor [Planctomycetota bacterium]